MAEKWWSLIGAIILFPWFMLSFLVTKELTDYPLLSKREIYKLIIISWIFPFLGALIAHVSMRHTFAQQEIVMVEKLL